MLILKRRPIMYKGNILELDIYDRFYKPEQEHANASGLMVCISMVNENQLLELYRINRLEGELKDYVEVKLL